MSAHLDLELADRADLTFAVTVASVAGLDGVDEVLRITQNGQPVRATELHDDVGTRLHRVLGEAGVLLLDYTATVTGRADVAPTREIDLVTFRRPSRYCESDTLLPVARSEFAGLEGKPLLDAVSSWVGDRLTYVPGSSQPTDGAVATLLARQGVCRDYAHLVVALLRGLDVPARLVAVFAPGLAPMDFHAVAEAWIEGAWHVVDATALAPRQSLLRISTGRDAADTAFLTSHGGDLTLRGIEVTAVVDALPADDLREFVQLG